jgi:hypothetical protein
VNALDRIGCALRGAPYGCSQSRDISGLRAPATLSDGWPVSTPAQQTLDAKLICATGPSLAKLTGANPHGALVVRNGMLVYEQYFAGDDNARIDMAGRRTS